MNKLLINIVACVVCLLFLSASADAQRRRTPTKRPPAKPTATTTASSNAEVKAGAKKVSDQLINVTRFIYVLGSVAQGIEDADAEAKKTGRASTTAADNKQKVIVSIRNLRAGLAALEVEFRTNPALKNYLFQIQGITDLSGQSEDLAAAGRLKDSGRVLVHVVERLSETLAAMP